MQEKSLKGFKSWFEEMTSSPALSGGTASGDIANFARPIGPLVRRQGKTGKKKRVY